MHAVKYDNFYVIITLISFRNKITYKIMRIFINNSLLSWKRTVPKFKLKSWFLLYHDFDQGNSQSCISILEDILGEAISIRFR